MIQQNLYQPIYSLLIALLVLTSCQGQNKNQAPTGKTSPLIGSLPQQPKLVKTQGSDKYASVICGIQDKQGNLWFGTSAEGVYRFDGTLFTQFTVNDGLSSNGIRSILEDKNGNIWFGTTDGICRSDGTKIEQIPIGFNIRPVITNNNYYNNWSTKNTVWSMFQDKNGLIWFGTGDGVYYYDGLQFYRFLADDYVINKGGLHLKMVTQILEDDKGNKWFACGMPPGYEGFCRYNGQMIESFTPQNEGWIHNVVKRKNGDFLLATRHFGVWTYNGTSFTDYAQPTELIKPSLNYILEDKAGRLWVASDYGKFEGDSLGGLWHSNFSTSNPSEKGFTKVTDQEVYFIFEDKAQQIWFSTRNTGLYRYDGKTIIKYAE
jgi:ligand-binding sensor domain-containing protein